MAAPGGWAIPVPQGRFSDFPAVLASLAGRGFVVASLDYRVSGEARHPAAAEDVTAAIRYLRANARRFGIDPDRVVLWGSSAGAQLAALVATRCPLGDDARPREPIGECVQGVVTWYGIFDLSSLEPDGARGILPDRGLSRMQPQPGAPSPPPKPAPSLMSTGPIRRS